MFQYRSILRSDKLEYAPHKRYDFRTWRDDKVRTSRDDYLCGRKEWCCPSAGILFFGRTLKPWCWGGFRSGANEACSALQATWHQAYPCLYSAWQETATATAALTLLCTLYSSVVQKPCISACVWRVIDIEMWQKTMILPDWETPQNLYPRVQLLFVESSVGTVAFQRVSDMRFNNIVVQ